MNDWLSITEVLIVILLVAFVSYWSGYLRRGKQQPTPTAAPEAGPTPVPESGIEHAKRVLAAAEPESLIFGKHYFVQRSIVSAYAEEPWIVKDLAFQNRDFCVPTREQALELMARCDAYMDGVR